MSIALRFIRWCINIRSGFDKRWLTFVFAVSEPKSFRNFSHISYSEINNPVNCFQLKKSLFVKFTSSGFIDVAT